MTAGRFPTYAAEERIGAGAVRVPLHGTPAPRLPEHVVEAVAHALSRPMATPHARGLEPLREALAGELLATTGRAVDPAGEILVTNGAMQGLGVVFRALLEPGDEVVVPAPCFFFEGPIRAAGGVPVYVGSAGRSTFAWDADAVGRAVGPAARVLLLCNPENPTGHVPGADEVAALVAVARERGLRIVTDEAYEASLWEGAVLSSAFGADHDAIVVRSLGKSLSMPHVRIGFVSGPGAAIEACAHTLEWDCLRVGVAAQTAALAALTGPRQWLDEVRSDLGRSRDVALAAVAACGSLHVDPPRGGPFLFVRSLDGAETLADELLAVGLPVVDGRQFQAPGWARLPFGGAEAARGELEAALAAWVAGRR